MKKQLLAMVAAALLVSSPVFAADNIVYDSSGEPVAYKDTGETVIVHDRGGLFGTGLFASSMERVRTTVRETTTKNARSDTEYGANRPNPGTTSTTVRVHEEVKYR